MSRRLLEALRTIAIMSVTTLVMLEIVLRIASAFGLFAPVERRTEPRFFYQDSNPIFGIWHPPDAEHRHQTSCFDVTYRSNSYGARDRERTRESDAPRIAVLGDSFVEGIGVEPEDRVTEQLEGLTGLEHLNFGTAGNFSSTQEWLLYEHFARDFAHDRVVLFLLPNNDFIENSESAFYTPYRYRPYLRRDASGGFELYYPLTMEEAAERLAEELQWNRVYNAVYLYRLYAWVQLRARAARAEATMGRSAPEYGYIGYNDFSDEDFAVLTHGYRELARAAGDRPVLIVSIPRFQELRLYEDRGEAFRLPELLTRFAESVPNLEYRDLLPAFVEDWRSQGRDLRDYFHPCDGHWSPLGHRIAAEALQDWTGAPRAGSGPAARDEARRAADAG